MTNRHSSKAHNGLSPGTRGDSTWPPPWLATSPEAPEPTSETTADAPEPPPGPVEPTSTSVVHQQPVCRCGSRHYVDVPIHNGESLRRDCAACRRFIGFPLWYGVVRMPPSEN